MPDPKETTEDTTEDTATKKKNHITTILGFIIISVVMGIIFISTSPMNVTWEGESILEPPNSTPVIESNVSVVSYSTPATPSKYVVAEMNKAEKKEMIRTAQTEILMEVFFR